MRVINGWRGPLQWDKVKIGLRLGPLTVFWLSVDVSGHQYQVTLCNFRLDIGQ